MDEGRNIWYEIYALTAMMNDMDSTIVFLSNEIVVAS